MPLHSAVKRCHPEAVPAAKNSAESEELDNEEEDASLEHLLIHVGSRIRELREIQDLSLPALEEFTGIHIKELRRIEAGKRNLTFRTANKIARAIGVHTWELVVPRERSSLRPKKKRRQDDDA